MEKESHTQEHVIKLCLPPDLYLALLKFQAKHELGRPYAGLLLLTKALYQEQLLTREVYERFLYRYSRRLVPEAAPKPQEQKTPLQKTVDYAALSLQQLEQEYMKAYTADNYTKRMMILGELKRRGLDIQRFQQQTHMKSHKETRQE